MRKFFERFAAILLAGACLVGCGNADTYSLHTMAQENYLKDDYKNFKLYANGTEELGKAETITLKVKGNAIIVSEKADCSGEYVPEAFIDCVGQGEYRISNLKVGTTYYYCGVTDNVYSKIASFKTDDRAPRIINVDGVTNVRDLGGWKTGSGTVKQGMIFRSSKFNANESKEPMITQNGVTAMVNGLGIKTEIDLRENENNESGNITESPLGNGVNYVSLPFQSGGNIILLNKDKLPKLFEILGNEDNYPLVFHCSIGTDRTGMVAFLINGLLGVSKEDLYKDFLFSNFGDIGKLRTPSIINTYMDTVDMSKGATLSEKIENYLLDAGVSTGDIEAVKDIMK